MPLLPGILSRNWQLKTAALAMAMLLWTVPRFESQSIQVLEEIPVRVQMNDSLMALVGEALPAAVDVTISGPARDLLSLGIDRPSLWVPMDEVLSGDTIVTLRTAWVRLSGRDAVVVEEVSPDEVTLTFERKVSQTVPFAAPLFGNLSRAISQAGPPVITPSEATVFGAASRFAGLDSLRLEPLDLSDWDGSGPIPLDVDTTGLGGLEIDPRVASVEIPTDSTTSREFPGQIVQPPLLASGPPLQALPASVTLVLMGPRSLVDGVDPEELRVTIPTARADIAPGQEVDVTVVVEGVPEFVVATAKPDWVKIIRPVGR